MKKAIKRMFGSGLPKLAALALVALFLAVGAAGSAWAAITATEVWEAAEIKSNYDSTTGLIAGHNNSAYKLNVGTGLVVDDSAGAYTLGSDGSITINSAALHGVTIDLAGKANGSNPTSLSILVKYKSLSACNQASLISAFMTRNGTKPECGLIQTANNALTLKPYWYIASDSSGYNFDISSPSVSASGGYALFSYDRSTIKGYTGSDLPELSGGTASMSWTGPSFKTAAIGGSSGEVTDNSFNNKWPGLVIEKIALFVGNAYTSDDIATYYFPSDDPTALDYDFVKTISSNTALSEITSWDTGTGTPGAEDTVHIVCENSAVLTIDTAINADTLWVEGGSVTLANGASITANMVFGSPITVAASATASISGASVYNSIACGSYSTLNISNCAINGAITDGDTSSNTHATLNITDCSINGGITAGQNNNATINTSGTVVFHSSADNHFKYSSTLNVNSGTTTYNSTNDRKLWCTINVAKGATLVNSRSDSFNYDAAANWPIHAYIRGTLTLNQKWTVAVGNYIHLYDGAVINGSASIHANKTGNQTKIVSENGTSTITAPVEKGNGSVSVQTKDGTTLVLTSSPELVKSGAGTLQLKDVAWTGAVSGSEGTVEVCNTRNNAHSQVSASGITFSGKIKFTAKGTYGVYVTNKDFLSTAVIPQLELDTGTSTYSKLFFKSTFDGVTTTIRDLMGSGGFTAKDSSSVAQNQTFISRQTQDTEFSGVFLSEDGVTDIHKTNLIVEGDGSGNVNTLKLSGANTSNGELTVRDDARVLFSSTGSWTNGTVTVADGGVLESQNSESIAATLAVQEGATLKFANGVPLAATAYDWSAVTSDGSVNVDLSEITPVSASVTLLPVGAGLTAADEEKFTISATKWGASADLSVEGGALKATFANLWRDGSWSGDIESGKNATLYISENSTLTVSEALNLGNVTVIKEGDGDIELTISGAGALTTGGWTIPAGVTVVTADGMEIAGDVTGGGIINVPANTTLTMDSVTTPGDTLADRVKVTVSGTLKTKGTTTLSAANTSAAGSLIEVVAGATTLSSAFKGLSGNITIDSGAELSWAESIGSNSNDQYYDHINPDGTTVLDIAGTLHQNYRMTEFGAKNKVLLRAGALVDGTIGDTDATTYYGYGHWTWLNSGLGLRAYGNAELAIYIRTPENVAPEFTVDENAVLTISQAFIPQTGRRDGAGSITKAGLGTLDLTAISPTKPITINAGKVVADEVPTANVTINENGTFTLQDCDWASGDRFSGTGTLELKTSAATTRVASASSTFAGKVKISSYDDSHYYAIGGATSSAPGFTAAPELVLGAPVTGTAGFALGKCYDGSYFAVTNFSGEGYVRADYDKSAATRTIKTTQTSDTEFSGIFQTDTTTMTALTVVGGEATGVHSLTLSGANTTTGTLNIGAYGKVVFSSTGSWAGTVVVNAGGWLESSNTTAVTSLNLHNGSNLLFPTATAASYLTGITNIRSLGTINVYISTGDPTAGDYLMTWSGADMTNARGTYYLTGSQADSFALTSDSTGLKVVAAAATVVNSANEHIGFATMSEAKSYLVMRAMLNDFDAYIVISGDPTEQEISDWASEGLTYSNHRLSVVVVAEVGATPYLRLRDAINAASSSDVVTLVHDLVDPTDQLIPLVKTIAFVEGDGATFTGSFSGTGTLVLDGAGLKSPASARWDAGWTGTVWLKNLSSYTLVPGNYGNADSVIKFTGVTAIIASGETFGPAVELEDDGATKALTLDCTTSYADNTVEFSEIRGTGTLVTSSSNDQYPRTNFKVLAWSDFAGSLDVDRGRVIFGTDTPSADTWRYVYVSSGAAVDVASGKTWKATEGFIVNGSLTCDGGELHGVAGESPTLKLGGSGVVTNAFEGGGAQCFNAGAITVSDSLSVVLLGGWSNFGTWTLNDTSSLGFDPGTDNDIWLNSIITSAGQNTTVHIYGNGVNKVVDNAQDGTKDAKIHVHNGGTFQVSNAAADNDRLMYDEPGNVGGITVDAGGLIVFKSRETYTRNTTLNGGTFRLDGVNSDRSLDLFKTVEFTVTDNSTIEATGTGHWIYLRGGTPTFNVSADKTLTMNAGFTYAGESKQNMIKAGAGTMVVNGYVDGGGAHESFSQPKGVTINAGTYELNAVQTSNGQTGNAANFYTVASGAKLKVGATGQVNTTTLTLNDGSLLEFGASSTLINATTVSFASGTTTVSFSTGVTPTIGTKLIAWTTGPVGSFNSSVVIGGVTYYLNKESDGLYVYSAATYDGTDYDTVQDAIDAMTTAGGALSDITVNSADAVIPAGYALVTNTSTGAMTIRAAGGDIYWTSGTYWAASYAGGDSPAVFTTTREGGSVTPYADGDTVVIPDGTLRFYGAITAGKTMKFDYAGTVPVSYTTAISASLKGSTIVITDGTTVEFQNASWAPSLTPIIYGCTITSTGTGKIAVANNVTLTVNNSSSITAPIVLSGSGSSLVVESGSTAPTPTTSVVGAFVQSSTDGSGTTTYTVADIVATVGGMPYASLVDAIDAASDGATITLVINTNEAITLNKNVTLTGAGVWSGTLFGTGTLTFDPDSTTLTTSMTISGSNTLRIEDALTITGSITVGGDATLSFAEGASLTLSGDLTAGSGLTVAPDKISSASATLVTANTVPANVTLVDPAEDGWTYRLVTTSTTISVTRTATPVVVFSYNAVPGASPNGGWGISSWSEGFQSSLRVGPSATLRVVYEVTSSEHPYGRIPDRTADYTVAAYVDVSKVASTDKRIVLSVGNKYRNSVVLYREGDYVKASYIYDNGTANGSIASVPVTAGFHLYTIVCNLSGSVPTLTLYKDATPEATVSASESVEFLVQAVGLGSAFNGGLNGFSTGEKAAFASVLGYDSALNAGDVADLAVEYPATDGTVIPGTVDNKTSDSAIGASVITVYDTMTGTGSLFLGVSGTATLNIPAGANVSVPHMRVQNVNTGNTVVNIDGTVNVTSVSTSSNVYNKRNDYEGILFGHWDGAGTGTYNITGALNAPYAWLQTVYKAGEQTINVNGGTVAVKGLYAAKDNSTVNVTNGGTLEVSESPTGSAITYNFAEGTYRITGGDTTVSTPITFSGATTAPTTIDPYGNEITMTAASLHGRGYITVADSSAAGNGKVIFPESAPSFTGYVVLNDDNGANIDISRYTGKVRLDGTNTTTIARLVGFRGTVIIEKPGTYHARNVDLTGLAIEVGKLGGESGIIFEADAGKEGQVKVWNGTCNLYVDNNTFLYEGHIFTGGLYQGSGTLTYYHAEASDVPSPTYAAGAKLTAEERAVVRPNATMWNLLPYYKIFIGNPNVVTDGKYYGSTDNPDHWNSGVVPADGNVAFKVEAGKTLVVDVSTNAVFNEVQIITYGSPTAVNRGTLVFRSEAGDKSITVTNGIYTASMFVDVEIESGVEFSAEDNAGIHVTDYSTATIKCGTDADPYEVPYLGGTGEVIVHEGCHVKFDRSEVWNLTVNGNVVVENVLATVANRSTFRVSQNLTVNNNGVMTMRNSSCEAAVLYITVNDGGLFECEGSHIKAYRLIMHGTGVAEFDSNSQLELVYDYPDYAKATGDGTVRFVGKLPDGTWWTNAFDNASNGWRGTVAVKDWDSSSSNPWSPKTYGNQYSTLEADNCNVYHFEDSANTSLPTLKLAGNLTIYNGSSGAVNNFAGLSGSGNLTIVKPSGAPTQTLRFANGADYTGSITNAKFKLVFGTSGGEAATITVNSGATAGLGDGATWKSEAIKIGGTLDVKGVGTLEVASGNAVTINGGATISLANAPLTVNGSVTLPTSATFAINPGAIDITDANGVGVPLITGITASDDLADGKIMTCATVTGASTATFVVAKTNGEKRDIVVYKRLPVASDATAVKVPIAWMLSKAGTAIAGETTIGGVEEVIQTQRGANGCTYIESYALGLTPSDASSVPTAGMTVNGDNFEIFLSNAVVPVGVVLGLSADTAAPGGEFADADNDTPVSVEGEGVDVSSSKVIIPISAATGTQRYRLKVSISGPSDPTP